MVAPMDVISTERMGAMTPASTVARRALWQKKSSTRNVNMKGSCKHNAVEHTPSSKDRQTMSG
eukprot:CAMPEP_0183596452 /NCGR_PEP_ID=MMETSP0371-20130417/175136_1 /TAXON_ID=268820 /ORGANISM="Peridinium aciculiferum, Strain PAER-2" /LENGTH=62 /DNA_ID=CAMNT_0025808327 /DNA_START=1 /DNA_END=189 /DNA_ORIENTATION=+